MKKGKIGAIAVGVVMAAGVFTSIACLEVIPSGYEGIVYSMSGGVESETLAEGVHFISPTKKVKEFTISNEQLNLTKAKKDDNSFKVSTSDEASIGISFQMSYRYKSDTLVSTYKNFRGMDGEDIVEKRLKNVLKSKVSEITANYSMMDIYSGKRSEINKKLTEYLNEAFTTAYGIEVLDASIVDTHPDEKMKEAIDARVTALQKKQQAEAEQEKVKVEAETALIKAQNEAQIAVTKANAEAEANKVKSASITEEIIRMTEAEARLKHGWVTVKGASVVATE